MKMKPITKITFLGMGIALYAVLSLVMNIPLLAGTHLQTDLGYIAFAVFLMLFGWQGAIVGIAGCFIESLITSGWVPYGWLLGQAFIGILCGIIYTKVKPKWVHFLVTVVAVFIGIAVIKTGVECAMFSIPLIIKFPKNCVAFVADLIPMLVGLGISYRLKKLVVKYQ